MCDPSGNFDSDGKKIAKKADQTPQKASTLNSSIANSMSNLVLPPHSAGGDQTARLFCCRRLRP